MGLTKEVRDFFTNRITVLLDKKIEQATQKVNKKKVREVSLQRFCDDYGLDPEKIARYAAVKEQKAELDREETKICNEVYDAVQRATNCRNNCYWGNVMDKLDETVLNKYRDAVIADLYPDVPPQLEKIQKIKDDVQGVVMLATTETKLVNRLTAVLQKYGGDIQELLDYIPKNDF